MLISDINRNHGKLIKNQLEYHFNNRIDIEIYNHKVLDKQIIDYCKAVFIIVTFALPFALDIPVIWINNIPTIEDLQFVGQIIDQHNEEYS